MNAFSPSSINVASAPFRRERAQNAGLALICFVLTCSLLVLISLIVHARAQAADLRHIIDAETAKLRQAQRDEAQFAAVLGKPDNADVFAKSVFFNELIARRGVSWTQVFKDLGTVMPSNVRLIGIRLPQVAAEEGNGVNHVELDMIVGTDRPDAVIDLLKNLQQSTLFGAAQVMNQQPPSQNDPSYKYRVAVAYAQKL